MFNWNRFSEADENFMPFIHSLYVWGCKAAWLKEEKRAGNEGSEKHVDLHITGERRGCHGGKELRVLIFLNNDLFTHLMATIPGWNIFTLPRINYGFPSSSWHEVHMLSTTGQCGAVQLQCQPYITTFTDDVYLFYLFICFNACLLKKTQLTCS